MNFLKVHCDATCSAPSLKVYGNGTCANVSVTGRQRDKAWAGLWARPNRAGLFFRAAREPCGVTVKINVWGWSFVSFVLKMAEQNDKNIISGKTIIRKNKNGI